MGLTRPVVLRAILHAMLVSTARGAFDVIDEGKGTPLVLVHGFPFDNASWRADARELAPGMRVLAPSMRGFGGSVPFDGIAGASVMGGLSMGGYVALAFARRHGARLRGLVLADTRAEPDSDETRANRDKAIARVEGGDLVGYVDGLLATILGATTRAEHPAIVESARAMAMRADPAAVVQALRAMRDRPDARPGLATIAVPVLIVVGEEDVLIPPAASEAMASALGKATVHVLRRAGHLANLEQAFREVVAGFVGRV
jgi:3-oxoadipate enol-lactonase